MMKVIINFGEKKVVVPCGNDGDLTVGDLIRIATNKYCKLSSSNSNSSINSDQVQLRLNNGAFLDPDDRVSDLVDDREELFAIIDSHGNSHGDLSSSITSSNLSEHERSQISRHEVVVTDADLRSRSLRVKNDPTSIIPVSSSFHGQIMKRNQKTYSPPTHDGNNRHFSSDDINTIQRVHQDEQSSSEKMFFVVLPKENSPLGIHVIPASTDEQYVNGLVIQNIEADGRVQRQGILQINDRIIEINRTNIERCSFDKAQLIFRTALLEAELQLKIVRSTRKPPIPPKSTSLRSNKTKTRPTLVEIQPNNTDHMLIDSNSNLNALNTRRLGKILKLNLVKGNDGLGFKLASRDNPTGAGNPIYVKTIFPKGAAIDDGRLQRGDRLLAVNSIDVTQMSLPDTVGLLRETRVGDTVELSISRQNDGTNNQEIQQDLSNPEMNGQQMTFDIPLNDTSSAGLGITLKGKTSIVNGKTVDFGIFVKSILTGGAASRDNRLRANDKILVINDSSVVHLSNTEAAGLLYEAVRREIHPGHIKITILRQTDPENEFSIYEVKDILPIPSSNFSVPNNDENELDLTNFFPAQNNQRKSPISSRSREKNLVDRQKKFSRTDDELDVIRGNPFDRETLFRQSVSEKRRLTNQPNKQVVQWKQRSFHESRTHPERKSYPISSAKSVEILAPVIDLSDDDIVDDNEQTTVDFKHKIRRSEQPARNLVDRSTTNHSTPTSLLRSTSFENVQINSEERKTPSNEPDGKRQAKLRGRTCNESFRQAVDKSYEQNISPDATEERSAKSEKQRFRFTSLFSTKSKRKENSEEKNVKLIQNSYSVSPAEDSRPILYPVQTAITIPVGQPSRADSGFSSSIKRSIPAHGGTYSYSTGSSSKFQGYLPHHFDSQRQSTENRSISNNFVPDGRYYSSFNSSKSHWNKQTLPM